MSTNNSNNHARAVEQIRASVERITRDFDNMISRLQMDNATIRMLSDRLPPLTNRGQSKPDSAAAPGGFQSFVESQAKQKAAGKELAVAASAFAQELVRWAKEIEKREQQRVNLSVLPSTPVLTAGNARMLDSFHAPGASPLTDQQRILLRRKNADAVAIIAEFGDKGEVVETPESLLNGPLKSGWLQNWGFMPETPKWDLRSQYNFLNDEDIALMESTRRNGVRALVALANAGKLSKSQVTALQLRGMGVLAEGTIDIAVVLVPYEGMSSFVLKSLEGGAEVTVGTGVREFASQPENAVTDNPVAFLNQFPEDRVASPIQLFTPEQISRSTFSRKLNYVVETDGSLVLGRINDALGGGHIDVAEGNPVLAAGEVRVVNGEILSVDNASGHYIPAGPSAQQAAEMAFRNAGFDISGRYIEKAWNGSAWVPVAKK